MIDREQIKVQESNLELLQQQLKTATDRYDAGTVSSKTAQLLLNATAVRFTATTAAGDHVAASWPTVTVAAAPGIITYNDIPLPLPRGVVTTT